MSYHHFTEILLGFQDLSDINLKKEDEKWHIYIKHKRKKCSCPVCGTKTDRIHDYREQKIKDRDIQGTPVILHLTKRRYVCTDCGKRFYEPLPYITRYARMTKRLKLAILEDLSNVKTFTDVARDHGVSVTTVERIFDIISYPKPEKLPLMFSIDEFKGNTGGEKYNCIIADPLKHVVLDILPKRYEHSLLPYFLAYPEEIRNRVEIFISDMWKPYQDMAQAVFRHSVRVIDKYHWSRQITWAFERVRKDIQKHMCSEKRIYFKHSRNLLITPFETLSNEDKQAVNVILRLLFFCLIESCMPLEQNLHLFLSQSVIISTKWISSSGAI